MTRYQKHMQHVHNIGQAMTIENAVMLVIEDVIEHLIKNGVKQDAPLLKQIRALGKYEYNPQKTLHG